MNVRQGRIYKDVGPLAGVNFGAQAMEAQNGHN